jgi:hypothetical protein
MGSSYRVLARDGAEYGPTTAQTLHGWYRDGRIGNDSLACEDGTFNWRRLDEIFDLLTWTLPGSEQASQTAIPDYTPRAPKETVWDDDRRTSGMLAAAILLFINAAFSIVLLVLVSFQLGYYAAETVTGTFVLAAAPTMYIIVGVGLLRGRWQWRVFAMVLAALGLALMVIRALYFQTPGYWIEAAFQGVFLAGMVTLLYGKPPSRERVLAGVITVVLAWFGAGGGGFVEEFFYTPDYIPASAEVDSNKWLTPELKIDDERDGYILNLPYGWVLLQANEAKIAAPGATLAGSHNGAGCFMTLRVEVRPSEEMSLDQYLTQFIASQKSKTPSIQEVRRSEATIGSREARRLETSWVESGRPTRGFHTVCQKGRSYYVLSGRCEESTYTSAYAAFRALEKSLEVRGVKPDAEPYARKVRSGPPAARKRP